MYYILNEENDSFAVYMSITLSSTSLVISFIAFLIATTSILSNDQLDEIVDSGVVTNIEAKRIEEEKKEQLEKEAKEDKNWKSKEAEDALKERKELQDRISNIENMPGDTSKQKAKRDHAWFRLRVDLDNRDSMRDK